MLYLLMLMLLVLLLSFLGLPYFRHIKEYFYCQSQMYDSEIFQPCIDDKKLFQGFQNVFRECYEMILLDGYYRLSFVN